MKPRPNQRCGDYGVGICSVWYCNFSHDKQPPTLTMDLCDILFQGYSMYNILFLAVYFWMELDLQRYLPLTPLNAHKSGLRASNKETYHIDYSYTAAQSVLALDAEAND